MRSEVTENYQTAIVRNFQFCTDLKTDEDEIDILGQPVVGP